MREQISKLQNLRGKSLSTSQAEVIKGGVYAHIIIIG